MDPTLTTGRYFGETLGRREARGLTVSEVRYRGRARIPPHAHARPIFNFVLAGRYTEHWGRKSLECDPSVLLFHPRGLVHSETFSPGGARCLALEFEPEAIGDDGGLAAIDENTRFPRERWGWIAARLRRELQCGDDLSDLVLDGLLRILVADVWRMAERRPPRHVETACEILHDRFLDPPRIADIARDTDVTASRLTRSFRQHLGCTPGEYARRLRVDRARRLIEETTLPLAEVAEAAGFADQSHLTRVFKRAVGLTPARYRRLHS